MFGSHAKIQTRAEFLNLVKLALQCFRNSDMFSCDVLHSYVISFALLTASGLPYWLQVFCFRRTITLVANVLHSCASSSPVYKGRLVRHWLQGKAPPPPQPQHSLRPPLSTMLLLLQRNTVWHRREIQIGRGGKYNVHAHQVGRWQSVQ